MSNKVNLSASLPVRRIIDGDTLSLYFTLSGVPLFQGINPDTNAVTPTWSDEVGKYPIITPHVGSARKNTVDLTSHRWFYNGTEITFAAGTTGWSTSTNFNGRFKLNRDDGSLGIIGNLASATNQDADVVTYRGVASVGSATYEMERSQDILIALLGGSAYFGGIEASSTMLGAFDQNGNEITTCVLKFWLKNSTGGDVSSFSVKLYRGDEVAVQKQDGNTTISIHRDKTSDSDKLYVDSHQLFIAEFYVPGVDEAVYRVGISIDDIADLYQFNLYSDNTDGVNGARNATIKAQIINTKTHVAATVGAGTMTFVVLKSKDLSEIRQSVVTFSSNDDFLAANLVVTSNDVADGDILVNCDIEAEIIG